MKTTDLLVKALSTPVVLFCRECREEFCAVAQSPAHCEQICLVCAATAWIKQHHPPRGCHKGETPTWFTIERYKLARLLAEFSQTILVQKYLPYIPKFEKETP